MEINVVESGLDIERVLTNILRREGFKKKGRNWFLDAPETISVVYLQRSQWSNLYYLNIGVFVTSLPDLSKHRQDMSSPKSYRCHFQLRLPDLMPDMELGHALFDLGNSSISPEDRAEQIAAATRTYALPLLRRCKTFEGIREAIREDPQLGYAALGELRKIVGNPTVERRRTQIPIG